MAGPGARVRSQPGATPRAAGGLPAVAIVGRPNVGKSALFNRLLARRHAIVADVPGVTRDRLEARCQWAGREFLLVDTGGLVSRPTAPLAIRIRQQAERAIAESQVVVFVVDAATGVTPEDVEIARVLHRSRRPVVMIANKVDGPARAASVHDFHTLGLGEPMAVSAAHGLGIGDLLDAIVAVIPQGGGGAAEETPQGERVAFVGRPNVGKSSLVNALLREDRVIVDEQPGTTRDAIDTPLHYDGRPMVIVDTAGLRRRSRVQEPVEFYSTRRTHDALVRADVAVLVIDAVDGITEQDQKIAREAYDAGRGIVIAVNKWDLLQGVASQQVRDVARHRLRFLGTPLVCTTVAITGEGIDDLMSAVVRAARAHATRIPTGPLNRFVEEAVRAREPNADARGRHLHIYYATQPQTKPPAIVLFVNDPRRCPPEYLRYLDRRLREAFDLAGTPVRWVLRGRRPPEDARRTR